MIPSYFYISDNIFNKKASENGLKKERK
jgi:hypothetical protein